MSLIREKIFIIILTVSIIINLAYIKNYNSFREKILGEQKKNSKPLQKEKEYIQVIYKPINPLTEEEKLFFRESLKLDLNKAVADDLMEISGIGKTTAQKIIKYREDNGNFKTIDDLKNVSGIGDTKFETFKYYLTVADFDSDKNMVFIESSKKRNQSDEIRTDMENPRSKKKSGKKILSSSDDGDKVDINNADMETLTSIKSVGKSAAQRIIDYREENNGFKNIDDLKNIKGFGPKKIEKIREFVTIERYKKKKYTGKEEVEPINLNSSEYEELRQIPFVTVKIAREIIKYREKKGGFSKITELKNIQGLDYTTYKKISKFFIIN
ncbi:helix-hairpin-helix domain-containing protein [Candidatus Dependentiae bacterium]|nr:helix-hairpin-helix domain-containing protein [Candidatus Dependentiae bacterium]